MRLIAGLGNPGPEYALTRHNIGWNTIDVIVEKMRAGESRNKFGGAFWSLSFEGDQLFLLKPYTYMNNSGVAIGEISRFYKIAPADILVVSDDINLPLGRMRLRAKGSAGGHNGLKSIIAHLSSQDFPRLRIGVDPCPPRYDLAAWVLGTFSGSDRDVADRAIDRAAEFCLKWCTSKIDRLMNSVNSYDAKSENGEA